MGVPQTAVDWVDYAKGFCIVMVMMIDARRRTAAGRRLDTPPSLRRRSACPTSF
jgi:hypothetical protein